MPGLFFNFWPTVTPPFALCQIIGPLTKQTNSDIYRPGMIYTFQALSEEDRGMWLDAMDGKEPMYVHAPKPSNAHQTFLDEGGFLFIQRCFQTLENRGLEDQGTIFTEP